MQLSQKRTFGEYFSDTFGFLRENGKHYFKNYFIIIGIPVAIMIALTVLMSSTLYRMLSYRGNFNQIIEGYMGDNMGLLLLFAIVFFVVAMVFSVIQYSYTPLYLILYNEKGKDFDYKDILSSIFREKIGKILIYLIVSTLLLIPVGIVMGIAFLILFITVVGIFIPTAALSLWYTMAFIAYLKDDKSIGQCFTYAWQMLFHKFWKNVGAVAIFMLAVLFISFGFQMIVSMFSNIATLGTLDNDPSSTLLIFIVVGTTVLSQMVSIFLQVFLQLMQGIVFFSIEEEIENKASILEIDNIGLSVQ